MFMEYETLAYIRLKLSGSINTEPFNIWLSPCIPQKLCCQCSLIEIDSLEAAKASRWSENWQEREQETQL